MKTTIRVFLAAVGLSLAAAATANPGDDYSPRGQMGGRGGDCGPRGESGPMGGEGRGPRGPEGAGYEQRLDTLKAELKLTESQLPAWNAFEKAIKAHGETLRSMRDRRPETQGGDPMDARIAFMEKQLASMKAISSARKDLYKKLTTEQKAVMDRHHQRMAPGPRGGGQDPRGDR